MCIHIVRYCASEYQSYVLNIAFSLGTFMIKLTEQINENTIFEGCYLISEKPWGS